ncbi:MAG: GspE/PulE family protein [Patescibacteria group bacterium]|nr:GspE/PulE family protein [Patescibacteria group bacterium]
MAKDLIAILLEKKYLTTDQVEDLKITAANLGQTIEEVLQVKNIISAEKLIEAKGEAYNIPVVILTGKMIDPQVLNIIPEEIAQSYQAVAFGLDNNILNIALKDPTDLKTREALDYLARNKELEVKYYLATSSDIDDVIKQYKGLVSEVEKALNQAQQSMSQKPSGTETVDQGFEELVKSEPVSKMVASILEHAVDERASDIHIEPILEQTRVRFRIDGVLKTSLTLPEYIHAALVSRVKVLSNLRIDETRVPQDGRFRTSIKNKKIDLRVSTFPLLGSNEKVVMRVLDVSQGIPTPEDLGFRGQGLKLLKKNFKKTHGMVLVTGPTGSGKSTTLYSLLNILNQEGVNIVTLEDPVEYYLQGVNQSQVNREVGLTFSAGLRSILRQDPDIIMVGEIRDNETAELATRAALTGHLVLSTLHTRDALGAFPRLVDMQIDDFLISSTTNLVIAQRLARRLCDKCRQKIVLPEKLQQEIKVELNQIADEHFENLNLNKKELTTANYKIEVYKPVGCPHCKQTGYKGRLAVFEAIEMTDELEKIITSGCRHEDLKKEFKRQNALSLRQDGILKSLEGLTSLEEIFTITSEDNS